MFFNRGTEDGGAIIAKIYEKYYGLMMYVAMGILKDHALAEDAVSESVEKMLKIPEKFGDISCNKTRALIVIIIKNTSINMLKKLKPLDLDSGDMIDETVDDSPGLLDEMISKEGYDELVKAVHELPQVYKEVAVLSLLNEMDQTEIAETLGIGYGTVRTRLSRLKNILRKKITGGEKNGTK